PTGVVFEATALQLSDFTHHVTDINVPANPDAAAAVGFSVYGNGVSTSSLWNTGARNSLYQRRFLAGWQYYDEPLSSRARGINDEGVVVGYQEEPYLDFTRWRAFMLTPDDPPESYVQDPELAHQFTHGPRTYRPNALVTTPLPIPDENVGSDAIAVNNASP